MTKPKTKKVKAGRRPGRPAGYSFSERTAAGILRRVRNGNYLRIACTAEGVPMSTFYDWLTRAAADVKAGRETTLTRFARALDQAEAEAESNLVQRLKGIADQKVDLGAALRATDVMLKKRWRERWGDSIAKLGPDDLRDADDEQLTHMMRETFGADPVVPGEVPDSENDEEDSEHE